MGLFRPSREHYGPDPYYHWKAILFAIGAALGLGGIFTDHDWLVLAAIPVLAVGVALRWLPRPGEEEAALAEAPDEDHPDEDDATEPGPPQPGEGGSRGARPPKIPPG